MYSICGCSNAFVNVYNGSEAYYIWLGFALSICSLGPGNTSQIDRNVTENET